LLSAADVLVCDPPYGALVEHVANTIALFSALRARCFG
jgi:23S rRNA G2445 N2-methylase RlmL